MKVATQFGKECEARIWHKLRAKWKAKKWLSEVKKGIEWYFFAQAHNFNAELKKFGKKLKDGACEEVKQLSDRTAYEPAYPSDLAKDETCKAMGSSFFLQKIETVQQKAKCVQM